MEGLRDSWRCLVDHDGHIEELDDRTGANFIRAFRDVVQYARALLHADREQIVFHLADHQNRWHHVRITQGPVLRGRAYAAVQMSVVEPPFNLTLRELDILTLVAIGLSNENIAVRLDISKRTIQKHVENLFGKMQLWSRTALASYAVQQGLCRLPTPGGSSGILLGLGEIEEAAARLNEPEVTPASLPRRTTRLRPLLIGLPYAKSGRGAKDSIEMLNGARLAVEEINARGGVFGRSVQLEEAGYHSGDLTSTSAAYNRLIEKEVDAITAGYACYSPTIHDAVGDTGIPCLHAATMNDAVERVKTGGSRFHNIFQTCASDVNYGVGLVRVIDQLQAKRHWCAQKKRLAIVTPEWTRLDVGIGQLELSLSRLGWKTEIVRIESDTPGDWERTVRMLHQADPSLIMLSSYYVEDAITFQRAFLANPLRAMIYDIYGPSVPQFQEDLGSSSEGVVWATTSGTHSDKIADRFRDRYQTSFQRQPGSSQAGLAYDRIHLLAGAWVRAQHPRLFKDVALDLRTAISRGVNGSYFLGSLGQVGLAYPDDTLDLSISQPHLIYQVQNGQNVVVGPAPFARSEITVPPWCL